MLLLCWNPGSAACSALTSPDCASLQICREFERFGKPMGVKVGNFFGGMDIKAHKDMLKDEEKCPDVVVGTPGRIKQVCVFRVGVGGS